MATRQAAVTHSRQLKHKSRRVRRAASAITRTGADSVRRALPTNLDCMENDYYRFLNQPRD
jgi:hypothetical protein